MNWITEYNLEPGTYQHYKKGIYVVLEILTHVDGPDGKMQALEDPLVCYRDLVSVVKHVNGKYVAAYQVYGRKISEFTATVEKEDGEKVKRFTKI